MFRSGNVIFPQGLSFHCTNTLCHIKIQLHSQEEGSLINVNAWVWFHFKPWLRPNSYEPRSKEYVSLLEPGQRPNSYEQRSTEYVSLLEAGQRPDTYEQRSKEGVSLLEAGQRTGAHDQRSKEYVSLF